MRSYALAGAALMIAPFFTFAGAQPVSRTALEITAAAEDSVTIIGRRSDMTGVATSASEIRVGFEDFRLRPLLREAELLETNPGMIATQHSGGGKSNQLFLRGFNLDHGTDFATYIDGMPVNMPTHGHGHGYTDINFLIPELVGAIDFQKGPYFADTGDFSSAGSARIRIRDDVSEPFFRFETGPDRYRRAVVGTATDLGRGSILIGGEVKGYDGPWEKSQDLKKVSGLARYRIDTDGGDRFTVTGMAYDNEWQASDQIPRRAVDEGIITAFGQIDPTLGGESSRYSLSLGWDRLDADRTWDAALYAVRYDLELYSNFSYFAGDEVDGDQIGQFDERTIIGGHLTHSRGVDALGLPHRAEVGVNARGDLITELGLFQTRERGILSPVREDEVNQITTGVHGSLETWWHEKLRSELGVRADYFGFDVDALTNEVNGGTETDIAVNPKATLIAGPFSGVEVYANAGLGFHSNDARGTTIVLDPATDDIVDAVDPIVQSRGAEVGLRLSPVDGWRTTVSAWGLELDSELVFVGDAGGTEASDESRRTGVEIANFYRISPWLSADLDVSFTRSRFVDVGDADRIPGALENVVAAGIMWDFPVGIFGAVRLRHLGEYPLIEDNSGRADATNLVNASLGYRFSDVAVSLSVLNVADSDDSDIQYYYESQLAGEAAPVEDVHFHRVEPRQARLSVSVGL